jgi:hypothetical protein
MFESNSLYSVKDLFAILAEDSSPSAASLLKELVEELHKQEFLEPVVNELVESSLNVIDPAARSNPHAHAMAPPAFRSILDNFSPALTVLKTLVRSDKRVCKELSALKAFLLDAALLEVPEHLKVNNIRPALLHNPRFIEANGRRGVAVENTTLLGQVLRIAPDLRDPKLHELFKEPMKQSRNAVEGNVADMRKRTEMAQSAASEILLAMLKAGGNSKTSFWMSINHIFLHTCSFCRYREDQCFELADPSRLSQRRGRKGSSFSTSRSLFWILR